MAARLARRQEDRAREWVALFVENIMSKTRTETVPKGE
jgi:hypothetical protein